MPLPPHALPLAKVRAARIYLNITDGWGHIIGAANGGPITAENLYTGVQAASSQLHTVEMELRGFRRQLVEWGALPNFQAQFVNDVDFWGLNLFLEIMKTVNATGRTGRPPAAVSLDMIRETLNYVRDIYNFGIYAPLLPYRRR